MKKNYRTALENVSGKKLSKAQTQLGNTTNAQILQNIPVENYQTNRTTSTSNEPAWKTAMRNMDVPPINTTTPYRETVITDPMDENWNTRIDSYHKSGNPWLNKVSYKDTRETISKDRTKLGTLGQKFLNIFRSKNKDKDVYTKEVANPTAGQWIPSYKKGGSIIR